MGLRHTLAHLNQYLQQNSQKMIIPPLPTVNRVVWISSSAMVLDNLKGARLKYKADFKISRLQALAVSTFTSTYQILS